MKTLNKLFHYLVDMDKQPQVKRKVRSVGNYFALIFVGLVVVAIGVGIFLGGLIFTQPVLDATQNYMNTLTSPFIQNFLQIFPLEYYVAFITLSIFFVVSGTFRIFNTVDDSGVINSLLDDKKEVKHEITQ